jgi:2-dehydropantoate 2-reductase
VTARILVVGGGAIGGITAARLAEAGHPVTVLDADPEHVARLRDPGLTITEADAQDVVPLDAVVSADDLDSRYDFALIAVKSPHHEAALAPLVAADAADVFVSLGNGLIHDRLAALLPDGSLLACLVEWGASNLGPGQVVRDTTAAMVVGELDGAVRARTRVVAGCLEAVGEAHVTDNVRGKIWAKLLTNTAFTGLSAVSGLRWGAVADHPSGRKGALAIWAEGVAVGRAASVAIEPVMGTRAGDLLDPARSAAALRAMMERVGNTMPSMLQDLQAGRPTEVDVVNGGVATRGRELGIPTPFNDRVVALVHAMERGEDRPDPRHLDVLAS